MSFLDNTTSLILLEDYFIRDKDSNKQQSSY